MATRLEKTQSVDSVLPNLVRFLKSLGTNKNAAPRSSSHNDAHKRCRIECNDIDCAIMDAAIFFFGLFDKHANGQSSRGRSTQFTSEAASGANSSGEERTSSTFP